MSSALLQPDVIDNYLLEEMEKDRIAGPFPTPPLTNFHTSRFGMIPWKHQPGKWCLILDLSSPNGSSVNNGREEPKLNGLKGGELKILFERKDNDEEGEEKLMHEPGKWFLRSQTIFQVIS